MVKEFFATAAVLAASWGLIQFPTDDAARKSDAATVAAYAANIGASAFETPQPEPGPQPEPPQFDPDFILPSGPQVRCLVFTTDNCRYCDDLKKQLDGLGRVGWKSGTGDGKDFLYLDTGGDDAAKAYANSMRVRGYPTMIVIDGRDEIARHVGSWDAGSISAWMNRLRQNTPRRSTESDASLDDSGEPFSSDLLVGFQPPKPLIEPPASHKDEASEGEQVGSEYVLFGRGRFNPVRNSRARRAARGGPVLFRGGCSSCGR